MNIPQSIIDQVNRNDEEKRNNRKMLRENRKKAIFAGREKLEKKGILLLFLSDYKYKDIKAKKGEADECEYYYDESVFYKGRQTNEAPVQYLYHKAGQDGFPIKKIICICSEKVKKEKVSDNEDGTTALEVFEKRIRDRWGCNAVVQEIDYNENDEDSERELISLYRELAGIADDMDDCKVYIDYSGGMRDINFLMVTIVRHMEFRGLQCGDIVYAQYDRNRKKQKIIDILYIYEMLRMINAVSEFVSTGSAKELNALSRKDPNPLFSGMKEFSDDMSLCNVEGIEGHIWEIDKELNKLETETKNNPDLMKCMVSTIIPTIRGKLFLNQILNGNNGIMSYPWLIKWCIDNNMIQQAMTIYVEKMPIYYKGMQYIMVDDMYQYEQYTVEGEKREWLKNWAEKMLVNNYPEVRNLNETQKKENAKLTIKKIDSWFSHAHEGYEGIELIDGIEPFILTERLKRLYDANGVKNDIGIYDTKEKANYISGFLKGIRNNKGIYIHYLLFDNKESYVPVEKKSNELQEDNQNETHAYENKWKIIEDIKNDPSCIDRKKISDDMDSDELIHIMEYYLAAKIIRNYLNHAGNKQIDSSMEEVKEKLKKDGIVIEMTIDGIKKIAMEGIANEL